MYLDIVILSHLQRGPVHGYELKRKVSETTAYALHNNTLYPALRRMQADGLPQLTPNWFLWTGSSFLISTAASTVKVRTDTGIEFDADVRIDTPGEADYYRHGGILQFVLRKMLHG